MPDFYSKEQIGVRDGTNPAGRADGRKVGARVHKIIATKPAAQAYANGDRIFVGRLRQGESLRNFTGNTDTTLGTTTLSLGTTAAPSKYANAKTLTTLDVPVSLGPRGTAADDDPLTADEDLWITLGVGGIGGAINLTFELDIAGLN